MMETPSKQFEDSTGGEFVENFAAGESRSVDETNNYVKNDAVEEEEPTKITKSDQGSVVLSDEDLRAKGLISFEEAFLLNKSDQVGNKVENAKGDKPESIRRTHRKTAEIKYTRAKMRMIAGKKNWLSCSSVRRWATWVRRFFLRTITLHLDLANLYCAQFASRQSIDK